MAAATMNTGRQFTLAAFPVLRVSDPFAWIANVHDAP
jgi:hypothetical protein